MQDIGAREEKGVPSEVLNGSLATSVRGIEARESTQQSSDDRDDLSAVRDVLGGFFQDEEGGLGVNTVRSSISYLSLTYKERRRERERERDHIRKHRVILLLRDLSNRLLKHLPDIVHDDINLPEILQRILEQLGHGTRRRQIGLVERHLDGGVLLLDLGLELASVVLGAGGVVVQGEVGAEAGEFERCRGPEVFGAAGDEGNLALERHGGVYV